MVDNLVYFLKNREIGQSMKGRKCAAKELLESKSAYPSKIDICDLTSQTRATFVMDFSPDGTKIVSTHGDHTVRITEVRSGKCISILRGHPRTPWCVSYHPSSNSLIASGCLGGQVRIWDLLGGGSEKWQAPTPAPVSSLAFHPNDHLLVFATPNKLHFWNWTVKEPFAVVSTATKYEKIRLLRFDHLGHFLYTGIANTTSIEPPHLSRTNQDQASSNVDMSASSRLRELLMNWRSFLRRFEQSNANAMERLRQLSHGGSLRNSYHTRRSMLETLRSSTNRRSFDQYQGRGQRHFYHRNRVFPHGSRGLRDRSHIAEFQTIELETMLEEQRSMFWERIHRQRETNHSENTLVGQSYEVDTLDDIEYQAPQEATIQQVPEISPYSPTLFMPINARPLRIEHLENTSYLRPLSSSRPMYSRAPRDAGEVSSPQTLNSTTIPRYVEDEPTVATQWTSELMVPPSRSPDNLDGSLIAPSQPLLDVSSSDSDLWNDATNPIQHNEDLSRVRTGPGPVIELIQPLVLRSRHVPRYRDNHDPVISYPAAPLSMQLDRNQRTVMGTSREPSYGASNNFSSEIFYPHSDDLFYIDPFLSTNPELGERTENFTRGSSRVTPLSLSANREMRDRLPGYSGGGSPIVPPSSANSRVRDGLTNDARSAAHTLGSLSSQPGRNVRSLNFNDDPNISSDPSTNLLGNPVVMLSDTVVEDYYRSSIHGRGSIADAFRDHEFMLDSQLTGDRQRYPTNILSNAQRSLERQSSYNSSPDFPSSFSRDTLSNTLAEGGSNTSGPSNPRVPRITITHAADRLIESDPTVDGLNDDELPPTRRYTHWNNPYPESGLETFHRGFGSSPFQLSRPIAGDLSFLSNSANVTYRIQRWNFVDGIIPDITRARENVIVSRCKLHNDASCDISQDSSLLATFLHQSFPDGTMLAVFSLRPESLGQCLYTQSLSVNAVSVSISPLNRYVAVGIAFRRINSFNNVNQIVAQVYRLAVPFCSDSSMSMIHVFNICHPDETVRAQVSLNSIRWIPVLGQGLVYGTNKGTLHLCKQESLIKTSKAPKLNENEESQDNDLMTDGFQRTASTQTDNTLRQEADRTDLLTLLLEDGI